MMVVDGFVGLKGFKPKRGTPVPFNTLLASVDSVACDSVSAQIVGRDPYKRDSKQHSN